MTKLIGVVILWSFACVGAYVVYHKVMSWKKKYDEAMSNMK